MHSRDNNTKLTAPIFTLHDWSIEHFSNISVFKALQLGNMIGFILVGLMAILCLLWMLQRRNSLDEIPGPIGLPFIGSEHLLQPASKIHLVMKRLTEKYGPILKFKKRVGTCVVVSDFDSIYEVTVKKGMEFAGRCGTYRDTLLTSDTGIMSSKKPDETWKTLRMATQKHIKQFGDGMTRLEYIINEIAEEMFTSFQKKEGVEFDPAEDIFLTAFSTMVLLLSGEIKNQDTDIHEKFHQYEMGILEAASYFAPINYFVVDYIHWLRWFPIKIMRKIHELLQLETELWNFFKGSNEGVSSANSLSKLLLELSRGPNPKITEIDARKTTMIVAFGGVTTTTNAFYTAINLLAHHPEIQERVWEEIQRVCPDGDVTLTDRPEMPYSRALIYEVLRIASVVPFAIPHVALTDSTIRSYKIPKDTTIFCNLWYLHHDPKFWKNPDSCMPERFLDEAGDLVPADHPNRKHLMPFSAGPRVCLGESLALSRLFLWVTSLVSRFHVSPAEDNHNTSTLPENFSYIGGVMSPDPYKVIFKRR